MFVRNQPQLFAFEIPSSENLAYIPLCVRFHLDRTGLRISLEDWQSLPMPVRVDLASHGIDDDIFGGADFSNAITALTRQYAGHDPEREAPPTSLPGDDRASIPPGILAQCTLSGLRVPNQDEWAGLSRFQRYALAKLSRKKTANHDFVPAMKEFGLTSTVR